MKKPLIILVFAVVPLFQTFLEAQVSVPVNFGIPGNYVGWNAAQLFSLKIKTEAAQPINFYTTAGLNAFNNLRMTILAGGNVGIGLNFATPTHLLDVRNGDINCGNGTAASPQGYMIGDNSVLRHSGNIQNIFVGVGAGFFNAAGTNNAFVGTAAGFVNTTGSRNSFLGWHPGLINDGSNDNTFIEVEV